MLSKFEQRFESKVDEISHLLLSVWAEDIYLEQIDDIISYYGEEEVRKAEEMLYNTTVFKLITNN